jgi:hypothetical protein
MAIDWKTFYKNRSEMPVEKMAPYAGQWVAWSPDGSDIVAGSSKSDEALWELLEATGRNPTDYVFGYIPDPDELILGVQVFKVQFPEGNGEPSPDA